MPRGQALVEFALILPILLLLVLGGLGVGLVEIQRYQLTHAAAEGAIAGANDHDPSTRCASALGAAVAVLGHEPTDKSCTTDSLVSVRLVMDVPVVVPFLPSPWRVSVIERAEVRP